VLIARLIADPDGLETRLEKVAAALAAAGMHKGCEIGSRALDDGKIILQITAPDGDQTMLRTIIEQNLASLAALITERNYAPLRLFVSDMDSTMIEQECIDELADFAGLKDQVSAITERAMRGEIDFEEALHERVGLLAGLPESAIAQCLEQRITLMPGAKTLVQTLKSKNCQTALVTGGFHHFADAIAQQLGFDRVVGNRLEVDGGKLTGGLEGPIADSATKLSVLREEQSKLVTGTVLATGDGANDIPMLKAADFGFAYKAKPKAREAASGWIDGRDLTAILELLDIPKNEWVTD